MCSMLTFFLLLLCCTPNHPFDEFSICSGYMLLYMENLGAYNVSFKGHLMVLFSVLPREKYQRHVLKLRLRCSIPLFGVSQGSTTLSSRIRFSICEPCSEHLACYWIDGYTPISI
ncbi:hypothetical protein QQ045_024591 [Rhodiola kirilowii]